MDCKKCTYCQAPALGPHVYYLMCNCYYHGDCLQHCYNPQKEGYFCWGDKRFSKRYFEEPQRTPSLNFSQMATVQIAQTRGPQSVSARGLQGTNPLYTLESDERGQSEDTIFSKTRVDNYSGTCPACGCRTLGSHFCANCHQPLPPR